MGVKAMASHDVVVLREMAATRVGRPTVRNDASWRVQSNENVTEGVSFYHLITSPESKASSFRSVVVYNG